MKSFRVLVPAVFLLGGCGFDGGPILDGNTDHNVNVGGPTQDAAPLSQQVRTALRNNGQTALARIQVSSVSEDTVELTGFVDNDATRQEAERVAGQVPGVRFVVNSLYIR